MCLTFLKLFEATAQAHEALALFLALLPKSAVAALFAQQSSSSNGLIMQESSRWSVLRDLVATLFLLGELHAEQGSVQQALYFFRRALAIARSIHAENLQKIVNLVIFYSIFCSLFV